MAQQLSQHRVYRAVEGRATGLLPFLPAEGAAALAVCVLLWLSVHLFVGLLGGGALLGGLMTWRRRDLGRQDYVQVGLRLRVEPSGQYDGTAPNTAHVPWKGR